MAWLRRRSRRARVLAAHGRRTALTPALCACEIRRNRRACTRAVRLDALGQPVMDGANLQVDAFHGAERSLDNRQALIRCDCHLRANLPLRHARAHHIEAVELRLGGDRTFIALEGEMA